MERLTNRDLQDILDLTYIANSQSELVTMRRDVLHAIGPGFEIERANFFLSDSHLRELDIADVVSLGIDRHYLEQYIDHYYHHDPFRAELHSGKVVSRSSEICPQSRWVNLEYYRDFLAQQKIHHELVIYLRSGTKLHGVLSLFRPSEQPNFSLKEVLKARILAPHLVTALENTRLLLKVKREKDLCEMAAEFPFLGIVLLDYELRPVYWNSRAEHICFSLSHRPNGVDGIDIKEFPIPTGIQKDCSILKELLREGEQIVPLTRVRTLFAAEDKSFRVKTSLAQQPSPNVSDPYFLVSLEDISMTHKIEEDIAKGMFHLTERELEIVCCAAEGLTNKEIAQKLSISRFTVENHLKSIFEKTGAVNRTELVKRIGFL